ncbi:MAG TPA: hypothetical protein VEP90_26360 [Methylomirabilota bacterium]|nr:hypothetical protein [Methylomirabilota bacterium]
MAKRIFYAAPANWTATAANAQATSGQYMSILGSSSTQVTDILEVLISGMSTTSTLGSFQLVRQGTLGTGGASALASPSSDGPANPATAALASTVTTAIAYVTNQVIPSNVTTDARLNLALNTFGGIIRWNAAPTQQYTISGNAAPGGACVLYNTSSTGVSGATAQANAHIIYETY